MSHKTDLDYLDLSYLGLYNSKHKDPRKVDLVAVELQWFKQALDYENLFQSR